MRSTPGSWILLMPLKASKRGKSRILVDRALRRRLVRAMAADTAEAAVAAPLVGSLLVIAEDPADAVAFKGIVGVTFRHTVADGLNTALADGLTAVRGARGVAVLLADLPSLRPHELDAALGQAARFGVVVVPDRHGTGSTLLAAWAPRRLEPQFGVGSFARHVSAGAVPLTLPAQSGLRRDVDCVEDLEDAAGMRTTAERRAAAYRTVGS